METRRIGDKEFPVKEYGINLKTGKPLIYEYCCICFICDAQFIGHKRDGLCPHCDVAVGEELKIIGEIECS
jgi:hypothetical protein